MELTPVVSPIGPVIDPPAASVVAILSPSNTGGTFKKSEA
jgi:hypothetical protein